MYTVYHNPRCKKSRAGLQYVIDKGMEYQVREYLKDPLSEAELSALVMKLHVKPVELVRTQEDVYKKELKGKNFTREEWIQILIVLPLTPCWREDPASPEVRLPGCGSHG